MDAELIVYTLFQYNVNLTIDSKSKRVQIPVSIVEIYFIWVGTTSRLYILHAEASSVEHTTLFLKKNGIMPQKDS